MKDNEVGIIGVGRMATETAVYLQKKGIKISFFADEYGDTDKEKDGIPHINIIKIPENVAVITAVGDPGLKMKLVKIVQEKNVQFLNCICSEIGGGVSLGQDVTVAPGCNVTTDIKIGSHVIINIGCNISHDVEVADFAYISPGVNIAGCSKIGEGVLVGVGATIIDRVTVGDNAIVGAGAVVTKDVSPGDKVVGVPARSIK